MNKLFKWIEKNKKLCFLILVGSVVLPAFVVHMLFKFKTEYYWLQAEWGPGELLGYCGDVLAFLGTVILGYVSLLLNEKTVKQNDKLIEMQHNQEKTISIFDQEKTLELYSENRDPILIKRLGKNGIDVNFDYVADTYHTQDIMIMEINLQNLTNNTITSISIDYFGIAINDKIIRPISGEKEELSGVITEKGQQKLKIILTGLKTILSDEQWQEMKLEFDLHCEISSKNAYGEVTTVQFKTSATRFGEVAKQGLLAYKIFNFDYKVFD